MTDTISVPVLPMRETALMPSVTAPVAAGRPGTVRAIEAALAEPDRRVFVVAQRENQDEVTPDLLHTVGTVARIGQVQRGPNGMQLLLHGQERATVVRYIEEDGYLTAIVREAPEIGPDDPNSPAFQALYRTARDRAADLGRKAGLPSSAVKQFLAEVTEPGRFADIVAGYLEISPAERQELLENLSTEARLHQVLLYIERQVAVLEAQEEIQSKVKAELGDRHREIYLRQQLKAIQKELGEDGGANPTEELREKLEAMALPEKVRKEVTRELARLDRMPGDSSEAQVVRTYLETIAELPWTTRSDEHLDLTRAAEILDEDHYALGDVKDRVLEFLAVRQLRQRPPNEGGDKARTKGPDADGASAGSQSSANLKGNPDEKAGKGQILLFVGPPGVGKTSVAKSIARAMGREYVRISLGGVRDEADIRGHRRTYVGAMPGRIIQGLKEAEVKNPVFLLDELDKLGVSFQGDPAAALLEVLDPAQNDTFTDHYLGVQFDLSEVMFIGTANLLQTIPPALLDRLEVVTFSGYTAGEKLEIARRYLIPRQLAEAGIRSEELAIADDAVKEVIARYTHESGVRQLEREIGRLARKVARKIANGDAAETGLAKDHVSELLGRPKVRPERAAARDEVGLATGMYYTPAGGDIMFVEVSTMPGKGDLVLTGQLGDVMKESARAAWSYARAHSEALHIEAHAFERDVHIHVPAGAVPKDGPSAGVTMATALVSALSGRPVRHDVAMTGEITLSGRILPIGGVKEKVLGAVRAGVTSIILPAENEDELEDIPAEVRETLQVHAVGELGEVLAITLRGGSFKKGRLLFGDQRPEDVPPLSASALSH